MSVIDRPEIQVEPNPSEGSWAVAVAGVRYRVREWTWGERRRLVDACVAGRTFDGDRFVNDLVRLVVSPLPSEGETPLLAAVALRLLGVDPDDRPPSLLSAEATLAATWGWGPAELDRQPAPRIDQHLVRLSPPHGEAPGWHAIVVEDD